MSINTYTRTLNENALKKEKKNHNNSNLNLKQNFLCTLPKVNTRGYNPEKSLNKQIL